jgi:glycosyltransferase involved in cell wall biosynthesis
MPKDLLLISGIYPPESGGPAIFAEKFSRWSSLQDWRVNVLTYSDIEHIEVPSLGLQIHRVARRKSIFWRYIAFARIIGRFVDKSDCVLSIGAFVETYISSIFLRFNYVAKVPGDIVWERARNAGRTNLTIEDFQKVPLAFKYRLFRIVFSRSLRRAKNVIVPSEGLYKLCLSWGVKSDRLHLIYNSITVPQEDELKPKSGSYDLLTVCRLTPWKGVDELIEYVANRRLRLVIAGDGPERCKLEDLASHLGADVTFLGDVAHNSIFQLFSQSKVFVLNSYYEGLPHALIEARGHKILSVARAGTGSEEVIHDDFDGLLVRQDRSLSVTLDLAFSREIDENNFVDRAFLDTKNRFSRELSFRSIIDVLEKTGR